MANPVDDDIFAADRAAAAKQLGTANGTADFDAFGGAAAPGAADVGAEDIFAADRQNALKQGLAPAPAAPAPTIADRFGSFATGANDAIAAGFGAPIDLATGVLNLIPRTINTLSGSDAVPLMTLPGGSASLRAALAGTVGRTDPKDTLDRVLYGAGGAVASVPLAGAAGMVAPSALAEALVPNSGYGLARSTALAAGSGAGSSAARDRVAQITSNPAALLMADLFGGVAGGGAVGAGLGMGRVGMQLGRPLTPSGRETIAGRVLNEATGASDPAEAASWVQSLVDQPQPAGITPSLGDLVNNRGLQAVQRVAQNRTPEAAAAAQQGVTDNNQAVLAAYGDIGQPGARTPEQISADAAARLETIRAQQHKSASDAFKAVDPGGTTLLPVAPLQERYNNYVTGLSQARQRFLPDTYGDLLSGYREAEPLSELQDFASTLKTEARQAGRGPNPDYNRANVLNGLTDAMFPEGGPEELLLPYLGPESAGGDLANARAQWRDYARTYTDRSTAAAIKDVLRPDGTYDSAAFDALLGPQQGQAERVQQFLRASQGDPTLLQSARDWFTAKMQAAGNTAPQDQVGAQLQNGNNLRKFVTANQPLIQSDVFDDAHRAAIGDVVDAANMLQRTGRATTAGGSDTYRNLATERYLTSGGFGMGPLAAILARAPAAAGTAAGTGLGSYLFGVPGAIGGGAIGGALGKMLTYDRPQTRVLDLVGQAVNNPQLAARLMAQGAENPPTPRFFAPGGGPRRLQDLLATGIGAFGQ